MRAPNQEKDQSKITPVQYEPDCPFKYNNFIYRLSLPVEILGGRGNIDEDRRYKRSGCVPIPGGLQEFILRLSNPDAAGMHQSTRVQNEVGILNLASAALRHVQPSVVPRVFGWEAANDQSPGWILEEMMPGVALADGFSSSMTADQRRGPLAQVAEMLKTLQEYPLPESIKGWGGVTFDANGSIISASMSNVGAGPWQSLEDSYRERFALALAEADKNIYLEGWHGNGVRGRIDAFIEHGLAMQFCGFASKHDRGIIHGDFSESLLRCAYSVNRRQQRTCLKLALKLRSSYREHAMRPRDRQDHSPPRLRLCQHSSPCKRVL